MNRNTTINPLTLDEDEVAQFAAIADEWWDETGKFKPLHQITPTRMSYLREQICSFYGRDDKAPDALKGLSIIDIGCGGGLVSEPLARQGASVTGVDPGHENIEAAKIHASQTNEQMGKKLDLTYLAERAEDVIARGKTFDVVLVLEVLEHVPDVAAFVKMASKLIKPGGLLIVSTINRNWKSYGLAIIGAEYILRWLPKGTHDWDKFITLDEMAAAFKAAGVKKRSEAGMILHPLKGWMISDDTDVNYFMVGGT